MAASRKTSKTGSGTTGGKGGTQKATRRTSKAGDSKPKATKAPEKSQPEVVMTVTHDQIAERAYEIWLRKGRPRGQDYNNWVEAEGELLNGHPRG